VLYDTQCLNSFKLSLIFTITIVKSITVRILKLREQSVEINTVEITYCTQCRWLLRAAWLAQELLTTFEQDLASVALKPGTNGIFEITLNQQLIFSRKDAGRFPEAKEVKQLVRDLIDPARDLGHSDRPQQ
jgi:selenoprotein W-related protein